MPAAPRIAALLGLALLASACGGEGDESGPDTSPAPTSAAATTETTTPAPTVPDPTTSGPGTTLSDAAPPPTFDAALEPVVTIAVQDLAARLGIEPSEIDVASAERVVWPDGSLGCPQPGMVYTQVQVDGYRIVLVAAGDEHAYHGGGNRGPFLCETAA